MNLLRRQQPDAKIAWLAALPWWRDLASEDLDVLASTGDRVTIPAGREIMAEGERGYESAIVITGEVDVSHDGEAVATLGPGDVVGELSLLDHAPRTADVRTATEVDLLVFSNRGLQRALAASAAVRDQITAAADDHRRLISRRRVPVGRPGPGSSPTCDPWTPGHPPAGHATPG